MIFDDICFDLQDRLSAARNYEENNAPCDSTLRPAFHLIARNGWMNDPNGFSEFGGVYHLFYQYYPYGPHWDVMHWGHAISKDLVKWEYLPAALAPDQTYDSYGVYSGSAFSCDDKHVLMYTAVEKTGEGKTPEGFNRERQTQCVAIGDGINYKKLPENPVILPEDIPDCMTQDFRDPKLWKEGDTYYAVMAARNHAHNGFLPIYSSKDLKNWNYCGTAFTNDPELGTMVECPDFFRLKADDSTRDILLTSVISLKGKGIEIPAGPGVIWMQGELAADKSAFDMKNMDMLDYGFDFYATHSLQSKDGRCILTAWMSNLQYIIAPVPDQWCGMECFPRELTWKNNRLYSLPVREIENYYQNEVRYDSLLLKDGQCTTLPGVSGRMIDLTIQIKETGSSVLHLYAAQNSDFCTELIYDAGQHLLTFDRSKSGTFYPGKDFAPEDHIRCVSVDPVNGAVTLRLLMDRFSMELFINDGEKAMSCMLSTPQEADQISFLCEGSAVIDVIKNEIVC